jgi:hypothetical protein
MSALGDRELPCSRAIPVPQVKTLDFDLFMAAC